MDQGEVKLVQYRGCGLDTEGRRGYWVEVDNDGALGADIADVIRAFPNTLNVEYKEYQGWYDWSADQYFRPCSVVSFSF